MCAWPPPLLTCATGDARARELCVSSGGIAKMAQKVVEEAAEVAIDAVRLQRLAVVNESVDLLYNLIVLWHEFEISPAEVWSEMDRREEVIGMIEKLPKEADSL